MAKQSSIVMIKTYVQSMAVPFICVTFLNQFNLFKLVSSLIFMVIGYLWELDGTINKMGFSAVHGK